MSEESNHSYEYKNRVNENQKKGKNEKKEENKKCDEEKYEKLEDKKEKKYRKKRWDEEGDEESEENENKNNNINNNVRQQKSSSLSNSSPIEECELNEESINNCSDIPKNNHSQFRKNSGNAYMSYSSENNNSFQKTIEQMGKL